LNQQPAVRCSTAFGRLNRTPAIPPCSLCHHSTCLATPCAEDELELEPVDSTIAHGRAEIAKLYQRPVTDTRKAKPAVSRPHNHMLLTNPVIDVKGNTAQAHVIWTGVKNEGVGKVPSLYEQGREDTELVKLNGKWLIKRRFISSDSGLPDRFDKTYKPRENPLKSP
jgi:hypothetical protein